MSVIAKLNYLRIAPRKVRLIADLIRGKSVEEAQKTLNFTVKRGVRPLSKLLKQAISNAKNNFQLEESNLYISKILVNEGPKLKRWRARARGVAAPIQKKTSHLTIVLDEVVKKPGKIKKLKKVRPETAGKIEKTEKTPEREKPKKETKIPRKQAKLRTETEIGKPQTERGVKRIFRRKAF